MKCRIIIKNQKYVPQTKEHWWQGWAGICRGSLRAMLNMFEEFDTIEDAKKCLAEYQSQKKDDGKIVWQENLV